MALAADIAATHRESVTREARCGRPDYMYRRSRPPGTRLVPAILLNKEPPGLNYKASPDEWAGLEGYHHAPGG
jgi:hypothetical protein